MQAKPSRITVDLAAYPDLVMILLGFRLRRLRAIPALLRIGRGLAAIDRDRPEGLLAHDSLLFGWNHIGIRQYWRDTDAMLAFTRDQPHGGWWRDFLRDQQGSGFWHETYTRGGIEAVYVAMPDAPGLGTFAPRIDAVGPMLTSRERLARDAARVAPPQSSGFDIPPPEGEGGPRSGGGVVSTNESRVAYPSTIATRRSPSPFRGGICSQN
ncbi:monooxygenase family protein [Stakelama tenebrarum]|uniref:DUF4188 domain-containing protein n=1 Tax=Stakelama tenebrarum TaxID=2711215 RepID=A0A6G6Y833_9SPHN|nr:DUF4188 domain-containing protein [Sphingosinithalassobacter tenebrarum]QIG80733.1 DUF4188 domain-containing protein [Sphingosinithalassobacter tenebrarum]